MAQVRKYSKGNAITKAAEGDPIIFKWDGYGDYNVADIEKTYARNINNYINSLDLDEEDKRKVKDESFRLLQGMKSGLLTNRDASGKWTNVPEGYESTGINEQERKKVLGFIPGKKQYVRDDDFIRNNAYGIIDLALKDTNLYSAPKADPSKFDTKFENYLLKYYFKDLPFNKALWDYNTSRPNIGARLADWRKEVEASDLDDEIKADLLNRIDAGIAGIQSATTDDDFAALARVGFDARKWIDPNYDLTTEQKAKIEAEEKVKEEAQKKADAERQVLRDQAQVISDTGVTNPKNLEEYYDQFTGDTYYGTIAGGIFFPQSIRRANGVLEKPTMKYFTPKETRDSEGKLISGYDPNVFVSWDPGNKNTYTTGNLAALAALSNTGDFESQRDAYNKIIQGIESALNNGKSELEGYLYYNTPATQPTNQQGSIENRLSYKLSSDQLNTINSILASNGLGDGGLRSITPASGNTYYTLPLETVKKLRNLGINFLKEGGVIPKYQNGNILENLKNSSLYNNQSNTPSNSSANSDSSTDIDLSDGNRPWELDKPTKLRIASVALDLAGLVGSALPGFSTVSGLTSTALNQRADKLEGQDFGWNHALSYGMDLASLIPGAKFLKSGTIIKNITKILPAAMVAFNAIPNGAAYANVLSKWKDNGFGLDGMTANDFKTLLEGFQLLAGGSAAIRRNNRLNRNINAMRSNKEVRLRTDNQGYVRVDNETYNAIKNAKDYDEASKILASKYPDATLPKEYKGFWRNKETGKPKLETKDVYNPIGEFEFTSPSGRSVRAGVSNVPFSTSNLIGTSHLDWNLGFVPKVLKTTGDVITHPVATTRDLIKSRKAKIEGEKVKTENLNKNINDIADDLSQVYTTLRQNSGTKALPQSGTPMKSSSFSRLKRRDTVDNTPNSDKTVVNTGKSKLREDEISSFRYKREKNQAKQAEENRLKKEANREKDLENKIKREQKKINEREYINWWLKTPNPKLFTETFQQPASRPAPSTNYTFYDMLVRQNRAKAQDKTHRKNTNLPKKEKKVSNSNRTRSNKGYVNRHQEGGILKAQQGNILKYQNPSKPLTGVTQGNNTTWYNTVFNSYIGNLLQGLRDNTFTYQDINNMQKQHYGIYSKAGNNFLNQAWVDPSVGKYQQSYSTFGGGFGNKIGITNAYNKGRYKASDSAYTGDNPTQSFKIDNAYSGVTDDRRILGREGDFTPEQLVQLNKQVGQFNLETYLDPTTKYYMLRPLQNTTLDTSGLDQEVADVNKNIPSPTDVLKSNLSGSPAIVEKPAPTTPKQLDWGNLLGTGRLIGTIATNNAIARGLKSSLSPLLLDPLQLRRQVVGDLATRNYMERLGAEANRLGARPITSDANLQLAQQLEYNNRANDYRTRGWLADKQAIDKTTAEAQKVADFNAEQRNTVANRNRAAMLGIRQAKANIEAQRKSANWQQAIAPWLMSMEMKFAENKKLNDQLNYQENQYTLGSQYDTAAKQAQDNLNAAKANYLAVDGNNEAGWLTSPEYIAAKKIYEQDLANATNAYQTGMLNARRKSLRYNPFLFVYKSGGRLSYKEKALLERAKDFNKSLLEDRKTFHKIIMESQKENNKLITSLSGLTKELIIKSMTYAD